MFKFKNFLNNENIKIIAKKEGMRVLEYQNDLSVTPMSATTSYFASKMNVRKRQVLIELDNDEYTISAGAMQWSVGKVEMETGIKGAGDFIGKALKGAVTKESAVKPVYRGKGILVLEPTYRYILLEDLSEWEGGMVLDDGMFLACSSNVNQSVVARSNLSSAVFGGEGLFNLKLEGTGVTALESLVPRDELVEITLENDVLKVDGNFAVAWSGTLDFTVEKSSKTLIGSGISGEGLVNVYRGTGRVLLAPINGQAMTQTHGSKAPDNGGGAVANAAINGIMGMLK